MQKEIVIEIDQLVDGYLATITYMGETDTIETNSVRDMRNALLHEYGVECIYNEVTGNLKACTQG